MKSQIVIGRRTTGGHIHFNFSHAALLALMAFIAWSCSAHAALKLGAGNKSLLGGDLTDPEDDIVDRGEYGAGQPEDKMRPEKGNWVQMKSSPNSPPGTAPHQIHAYQSWQNTPAVAIFLNNPEKMKWYVGFKDGGRSGPTEKLPYYCAVQFSNACVLTHFTISTALDMPGRDPKVWGIQASDTGKDDDWTDVYRCTPKDRARSPLREKPRAETTLFTAFTTADMAKIVSKEDLKKLEPRLKDQAIETADFTLPAKPYTWYRIVILSCFNPNSNVYADFNRPPGFGLGQLEFFGVPGKK